MKFIIPLFSILGLVLGQNVALATETEKPVAPISENPFDGPLVARISQAPVDAATHNEDLSNPFVEGHWVEQILYMNSYLSHYHMVPGNPSAPKPPEPSSALDGQGHPLWFDRPYGDQILRGLVVTLTAASQFDDLDRLFADWSQSSERMADGRWKLLMFHDAMGQQFSGMSDWDASYRILQDWRKKNPKSAAAAVAEAIYWYDYAWNARGNGYANTVTADGWRLFNERLEKAETILIDSKPYASSNPLWWRVKLEVGGGLGLPIQDMLKEFEAGAAVEKYFYPAYTAMVTRLTPKWGGDWNLVDHFIKDAVKNTQDVEGYSMYARLYWSVDSCGCELSNLFRETQASWPDMKHGFEDLIRSYPHSAWIANKYAVYACMADDKDTFQAQRLRIGKMITPDAWPSNCSLDLCEHKYPTQPL